MTSPLPPGFTRLRGSTVPQRVTFYRPDPTDEGIAEVTMTDDNCECCGEDADARPESAAEAVAAPARGNSPTKLVTVSQAHLRALEDERDAARAHAADLDISRVQEAQRADELLARSLRAEDEVRNLREGRDRLYERVEALESAAEEWKRNCQNWEAQYHTLFEMTRDPGGPTTPRHRVSTWHEADGSVTIRVEAR